MVFRELHFALLALFVALLADTAFFLRVAVKHNDSTTLGLLSLRVESPRPHSFNWETST